MPNFKDHFLFNKFVKTTAIDALFFFVIYLYLSFLSPYLSTLGWSEATKGYFFSLFAFIGIFAAPILGTISDKIGRYKVIIIGMFLEILALVGYITITSTVFLFAIRIISAIAFNAVTVTAISRINDTVEDNTRRSRINGIFHSVISVAAISAPLVGGFIADYYGYTTVFSVALATLVVIMLGLLFFDTVFYNDNRPHRKRTRIKSKDLNPFSDVNDAMKYPNLRNIILLGGIGNFVAPLMVLVIPFILIQKMGLTNAQLSIAVFMMGAAHLLQIFTGQIADKVGKRKTIVMGLTVSTIGFIMMFFSPTYEILLLALFIKAIGGALSNISIWSFISDIAEANNIEGKVVGSYSSVARISMTISFAVGGLLLQILDTKIFLLYAAFVFAPVLIFSKMLFGENPLRKKSLKNKKIKKVKN